MLDFETLARLLTTWAKNMDAGDQAAGTTDAQTGTTDDLAAELDHISACIEIAVGLPMTADPRRVVEIHAPRLVAALEAVLKLADDWDAEAVKAEDRVQLASERGDGTACAVLYARATALSQNTRGLREAIAREITGKGESDDR